MIAIVCEGDEEVSQDGGSRYPDSADHRIAAADPGDRSAAVAGLSHRGAAGLRCGSAAQSGQERYGRVRQLRIRFRFPPSGKGFTIHAAKWVAGSSTKRPTTGLLTVFVQHTSASLVIQENADPDVGGPGGFLRSPGSGGYPAVPPYRGRPRRHDLAYPVGSDADATHDPDSPGPVGARTWQGIYLFEHRVAAQRRSVVLHLLMD